VSAQPHAHTHKTASLGALCFALLCFVPLLSLLRLSSARAAAARPLARCFLQQQQTHAYSHAYSHALLAFSAVGSDDDSDDGIAPPAAWLALRCCCSFAATLGQGHPTTLAARNNLAVTLKNLGEVRRAEEEHQAVLEARIVQLGSDHADTLISMYNLGALLAAAVCFAKTGWLCFRPFSRCCCRRCIAADAASVRL
jgi:hypothetical protein